MRRAVDRLGRRQFHDAVAAALRDRAGDQIAADARDRLSNPTRLDYVGSAIKRDIPQYARYADAIATAYLDDVDASD